MTVTIGRRELLVALGGAAVSWPIAARAAGPRPRIAVLSINSEQDERKNVVAFVDGLRALGYVTSQNVDIDYRYAEGDTTRLKPLAQELIAFKPDVAFANSPSPAVAVQSVAPSLPIVCPQISDFLVPNLVVNYARPGGSVTGMASTVEGVATKLLELALDAVLGSTRIGFLANPAGASMALWVQQVETAARARGVTLLIQEARTPDDLAPAFDGLAKQRSQAVIVPANGLFQTEDCTPMAWYRCVYAPRAGGAHDSHHRTAGIAGRTRRRGGVVANRGARGRTAPTHRGPLDQF
jgi:putative ABC transport system substrate-binding protein